MLLVSVQNPVDKSNKVCVVSPECISEFLNQYVPTNCVALVQDVVVYDGKNVVSFKSRWYGRNEEK